MPLGLCFALVRMIVQGEKVVGTRVGNLRIRAYDRIYYPMSGRARSDEYEVREFECDWYEKLYEKTEILDIRLNSIFYTDLYVLSQDGGYSIVCTRWRDGEDMFLNQFVAVTIPTCATMKKLVRKMKALEFDETMIELVKGYDPVWNAVH